MIIRASRFLSHDELHSTPLCRQQRRLGSTGGADASTFYSTDSGVRTSTGRVGCALGWDCRADGS